MNAHKFAIWYVVNKTNFIPFGEQEYYGGFSFRRDDCEKEIKTLLGFATYDQIIKSSAYFDKNKNLLTAIKDKISELGIDYEHSTLKKDYGSSFEGTFTDSSTVEYTSGVLALNKGVRIPFVSEEVIDSSKFVSYFSAFDEFKKEFSNE